MSKGDWSWIRQEAAQRGMTIPQLASYLGVTPQAVNHWANNRNDPDFLNIVRLVYTLCDGSLEVLASRTGISLRALSQDLRAQAEALGIEPPPFIANGPGETILLNLPPDALLSPNALAERFKEAYYSVTDILKYTSHFEELSATANRLLKHMPGGDVPFKARLHYDLGYAALMLGRYPEGIRATTQARAMLSGQKDPMLLADTHWLSGECLRITGELHQARWHCEEADKIHQRLKARASAGEPGPMWVEWNLGCIEAACGRYDRAIDHFTRLHRMATGVRLPEARVLALWGRAYVDELQGEFERALAGYLRAKQFAERAGDRFWRAEALWRMAEIARKVSNFKEAIDQAQAARAIYESIGNESMPAKLSCTIAACHLQIGEAGRALELYRDAAAVFTRNDDWPMRRRALSGYGLALLAQESDKPEPAYRKLLPHFLEIEVMGPGEYDRHLEAYECLAHAEALRLAGHLDKALEQYHIVAEASASYGHPLEQAHALLGMAETARMMGRADRTGCHQALTIYRRVGSKWGQVQALITLALIEVAAGGSPAPLVHRAAQIAGEASLKAESRVIESIASGHLTPENQRVLLFV